MTQEFEEAINWLTTQLGKEVITEAELSDRFLNRVTLPYLRSKIGLLADAKLERRIKKGRYDARIGSFLIEFERPLKGIDEGIGQGKRYVEEYRVKGEAVKCFVTDGHLAVFVDEQGEEGEVKTLVDIIPELLEQLSILALMPAEPEDLLRVLGPASDICRSHIKGLLDIFSESKDIPFVLECFDLWGRVYGAAANLTPAVIEAVKSYAEGLGIELRTRMHVEEFLFIVETYLSIFMKLLVASVAVQRGLVTAPKLSELLSPPLESFEKLSDRVPFLRRAFEHDAFSWFVDAAKRDKTVAHRIGEVIGGMSLALDKIDLSKVRVDLLRRVYQEFFDPETRKALGEFYTNEKIVGEILDAVNYDGEIVVKKTLLDPACGSGTFLIMAIRKFIKEGRKKGLSNVELLECISKQILGIDIHPFAVAMARVNYLLAVSMLIDPTVRRVLGEFVVPIYWTDSLASFSRRPEPAGIPVIEVDVSPLGNFLLPDHEGIAWDYLLDTTRKAVDMGWDESRYLQEFPKDVALKYKHTLIELFRKFKQRAKEGRDSRWLSTLRNVMIVDRLRGKCDFIVGNPPWVRIHNVDDQLRRRIGERFEFYGKKAGWDPRFKRTKIPFREQVDYSLAFVEAALKYLKEGESFGFVITSNVIRSLYAGKMRRKLLEETTILNLVDYSLSKVKLFEKAQNAPLILTFKKQKALGNHKVRVKMVNRLEKERVWEIEQEELPLVKGDPASSWLIAPPEVVAAMRKMQRTGSRLGDAFSINMGIKTAANPIFYVEDIEPTDEPEIVLVNTTGGQRERIERRLLRLLVRGRDIDSWRYRKRGYIIWTHNDVNGSVLTDLPPNAKAYFEDNQVKDALLSRSDYKEEQPPWVIFRISEKKLKDKVAWQKIARSIEATYLPSDDEDERLGRKILVVDSSVYFIGAERLGLEMTGILNSTLARAYSAAFVNRTGAVYCQYFAWIIGLIPVPERVIEGRVMELIEITKKLQQVRGKDSELLKRLDKVVASLYGISKEELSFMQDYHSFFVAG